MRLLLALTIAGLLAGCSRETSAQKTDPDARPPTAAPIASARLGAENGAPTFPTVPHGLPGSDGANGSGCAPGPGPLPDGVWFGHAVAWDEGGIDFDLACMFTGEAATKESAKRGDESPPPNGFYIVNDSTALRRVPVAPDAKGYRLTDQGEMPLVPITYKELVADSGTFQPCPGAWCPVWVFISGGSATDVMQQYIP